MKKWIIIFLVLSLMEGISWWVYRTLSSKETAFDVQKVSEDNQNQSLAESNQNDPVKIYEQEKKEVTELQKSAQSGSASGGKNIPIEDIPPVTFSGNWDAGSFPPPSTEVVSGVTERTIHIGVRQWVWDPQIITAKKGELVRLIVHNADVKHGLVIPELGVNEDISPDGAVITFQATKKGTFEFFCSVYCGEGHIEMRGKVIIE